MNIVKIEKDMRPGIKFRKMVYLENGDKGKIIEINNQDTGYIIKENGNVVNINTDHTLKAFTIHSCGYKAVNIQLGKRGKYKTCTLHRLLGLAYISNIENKPVINHIDGNKANLKLSNLEWVTYSENNYHAYKTNLRHPPTVSPEKCNLSTHNIKDVNLVCQLLQSGMSPKKISKLYPNYGYDFIIKLKRGETWIETTKKYTFPNRPRYMRNFSKDQMDKLYELSKNTKSPKECLEILSIPYSESNRKKVSYALKQIKSSRGPA